jgi:hypothetical protein
LVRKKLCQYRQSSRKGYGNEQLWALRSTQGVMPLVFGQAKEFQWFKEGWEEKAKRH